MLKKTIKYTDFNGNEQTEEHHFHLSKADLIEMEVGRKGGMAKWLEEVVKSEDGAQIIAVFKDLILKSYGKKSDDGKRFIKTEELREEFVSTEAYSTLFMELCTDTDAAIAFVNGITPAGLENDVAKITQAAKDAGVLPAEAKVEAALSEESTAVEDPTGLTNPVTPRVLTQAEVVAMDGDELKAGLADGRYKLS